MRHAQRWAVGMMAAAVMTAAAADARADENGYVCSVSNHPPISTSDGPGGSIVFTIYSGPDCTGSFVKTYSVCSTAATDGSSFCHPPVSFDQLHRSLLQALTSNQRITTTPYNIFGNTAFLHYLTLNAN